MRSYTDSKEFEAQDTQYEFPYHYIPTYEYGNFHIAKTRLVGYEYMSYLDYVMGQLGRVKRYLDVGTGDGRMVYEVNKRFQCEIVRGIDLSPNAVAFARAFNGSDEIVEGDITNEEVFDGLKFTHATCIEVLEHIPPDLLGHFVDGIAYHLEKDAVFIVTVPSDNVPVSKKHFQHFNKENLVDVLGKHFEIQDFRYINRQSLYVEMMRKVLENKLFVLNHKFILRKLFQYYQSRHFFGDQKNTRRIYCRCVKR